MFQDFISLVFPVYCLSCRDALEKNEDLVCTRCRIELPRTGFHLQADNALARKFWGRVEIQQAMAFLKFLKGGSVQNLMHHLKYKGAQEVGELLGRWYGDELAEAGLAPGFDLIVPVPLHPSKLKKRGYNQSDCFARGLSAALNVPWQADVMNRSIQTDSQTRNARFSRWENVSDIYLVKKPEAIKARQILLVDDVVTTGATLESCAGALLQAGAAGVSVAAIAAAE